MGTLILHIDDERGLPADVAPVLEHEGYELVHTSDPEAAVDLLVRRRPALVVMDPRLSTCDGLDLLEGIRAQAPDVPVLILTRAPRSSLLFGEVVARGVQDFLSKPVLASQLLTTVRELAPPARPKTPPEAQPAGLSGDLGNTPMPELLARLRRRAATGVLIASCRDRRRVVQLRNGSVVAVGSARVRADGRPARTSSDGDAEAQLFETFAWTSGSYRFSEDRRIRSEAALEITRDTAALLLTGALEAAPATLVRDRLHKRTSLYVSAVEGDGAPLDGLEITPEQARRLAETEGEGTLGEMLASGVFDERLLYALWVAGRLELHAAPTLVLRDVQPLPEPAPLGVERAAPGVEPAPPGVEPAAHGAQPAPPEVEQAAEEPRDVADVVRALSQQVMSSDDFDALGIPLFVPDAQVRAAYECRLAAIPEEALCSPDPEIRARATRIRERIERAYENVKDSETRRAHALLRQEEEQDRDAQVSADRWLEAERWFRKGQGFLDKKRHSEAIEAFGMASHLDPGEGEYLSHLGYAMYLAGPDQEVVRREAMEHIANGIKRSPARELSYVYLGRILRSQGDIEVARKVFRRALRVNANCRLALQELRLLEMREQKGRGILSRLWRR